ncbi:MAG: hypothetical protein ABIP94_20300, partial [Planctomycetota bacterium]
GGSRLVNTKNTLPWAMLIAAALLLPTACCGPTQDLVVIGAAHDRYDHNRQTRFLTWSYQDRIPGGERETKTLILNRTSRDEAYTPLGHSAVPSAVGSEAVDALPAAHLTPVFTGVALPLATPGDRDDLIDFLGTGPAAKAGVERRDVQGALPSETERRYQAVLDLLASATQLASRAKVLEWAAANGVRHSFDIVDSRYQASSFADRVALRHGDLAKLLAALADLREAWEDDGAHKLVTVQLGDFFDLWREFGGIAHPENIVDDEWGALRDVLYRGVFRRRPCLKATMLLGNHDTKRGVPLAEIPFLLKACNRDDNGQPFLFTTHGDAFDVIEQLVNDWLQEFVVHFLGRLTPVNKYPVAEWGRQAGKLNKALGDMQTAVVAELHDVEVPQGAPIVEPNRNLPDRLVMPVANPEKEKQNAFDHYPRALTAAAASSPAAEKLRVVAVGHSHRATMLWHDDPARPMLLMDAGAWIEKCKYPLAEGGTVTEPNAQLGVIHGNDARVYQVRLRS